MWLNVKSVAIVTFNARHANTLSRGGVSIMLFTAQTTSDWPKNNHIPNRHAANNNVYFRYSYKYNACGSIYLPVDHFHFCSCRSSYTWRAAQLNVPLKEAERVVTGLLKCSVYWTWCVLHSCPWCKAEYTLKSFWFSLWPVTPVGIDQILKH